MDSRKALKENTVLKFDSGFCCTITDELARGGKSLVYDAFYTDNLGEKKSVRVKECWPFCCSLQRRDDGTLIIPDTETALFEETKQKMIQAYQYGNEFFHTSGLTNFTANTYNIFEANNTIYIVTAYSEGQELSFHRYPSVKDSIAAVRSTAAAIQKIHSRGFLYLDIKPDNILTLEGTTELVWLFDFDTVVPISDLSDCQSKISFTEGFAALEQQMGDERHIGTHTDVYGIGALLFYMLFNRVPDAFDCEANAVYNYSESKLASGTYQDQLTFRLTDFFHHTLSAYYLNRWSNMETVIRQLSELQELSDLSARYVCNSRISSTPLCLGREAETAWLSEHLTARTGGCFFLTGMGGIGKSTLVRNFIRQNQSHFDSVLYLNYTGTLEQTIVDDYSLCINAVHRDREETDSDYFFRKMGILRDLAREKHCIMIIDNYTGDETGTFENLMQLGWSILFIARDKSLSAGFPSLELHAIANSRDLLTIFEKNLGRSLTSDEQKHAASIIRRLGGHTLTIELIAKQIGSPLCNQSLEKTSEFIERNGFLDLSSETISYRKDSAVYHRTIKHVIGGLLTSEVLSESRQTILKTLALFGRRGISIDLFCKMLDHADKDGISAMYHHGWIYVEDTIITMHPVIEEVIADRKTSSAAADAAAKIFRYLIRHLQNQPSQYLLLAASVLDAAKKDRVLTALDLYRDLLYQAIRKMPYENEVWILEKTEEYISADTNSDSGQKSSVYIDRKRTPGLAVSDLNAAGEPPGRSQARLVKVYKELLEIYYEHSAFDMSAQRIAQLKKTIAHCKSHYVWGLYYDLLGTYYDNLLNGAYDAQTREEIHLVQLMQNAADQAIHHLSLCRCRESQKLLGESYRAKALLLIRSGRGRKKQILTLLRNVSELNRRWEDPHSKAVRNYYMTMAWYFTYVERNFTKTRAYMFQACRITDLITDSDLVKIDEQLSPMANLYLEWQEYEVSAHYLRACISLCESHSEIMAYKRRREELFEHLYDVYLSRR